MFDGFHGNQAAQGTLQVFQFRLPAGKHHLLVPYVRFATEHCLQQPQIAVVGAEQAENVHSLYRDSPRGLTAIGGFYQYSSFLSASGIRTTHIPSPVKR